MAKMTDLPLDTPGDTSHEAQEFLTVLEGMRGSGKYDWADETLRGISETVQRSQRVSEGQRRAVLNFLHSREEEMEDYA